MSTLSVGRLLLIAALCSIGSQGSGATMTFDGINDDEMAFSYFEKGITVTGNGTLGLYSTGSIHMDDSGTSAPSSVTFTMAKRFRAISFEFPLGSILQKCTDSQCTYTTYDNLLIEGFRGGKSVISQLINTSVTPTNTFRFSRAYSGLTSLRLSVLFPDKVWDVPDATGTWYTCTFPCAHGNLDNVTLAPVPVPAALPLAGSALAVLGFLGARNRRNSPHSVNRDRAENM